MTEELTPVFMDPAKKRKLIQLKVLEGIQESFPMKTRNKTLEIDDLRILDKDFGSSEQKDAILRGESLFETVKGTVRIKNSEGKVIDEVKNFTLARIPYFTPRHTFIVGGNEYSVSNMVRRKPGVYARKRANGILEAAFNTVGGSNFRISMDPEKGEPQIEYSSTKTPLYPLLLAMGISKDKIAEGWGKELVDLHDKTYSKKIDQYVDKLYRKEVPEFAQKATTKDEKVKEILQRYERTLMDPEVNQQTLGKPYSHVTPESLLDASSKVLRIFKSTDDVDDQDNLDFKRLYGVEDFFKERIKLDARDIAKKVAIKIDAHPELRRVLPTGPFTSGILKFINTSQLASVPTQTNPMELIDAAVRVTSLGEGGISTERAIPVEARQTHATQIGALDPIRTPESFRAGIDIRAAINAHKDKEGNIFVPIYNVKSKRYQFIRAGDLQRNVIAFPNQELKGHVDALVQGQVKKIHADKVDYQIPHASYFYSPTTNLVPLIESIQGNRAVMSSKHQTQALSLLERDAPYVQVMSPSGHTYEELFGKMINPTSPVDGTVEKIDKDYIYIRPKHTKRAGEEEKTAAKKDELIKVDYNHNFPLAAKTYVNHELKVKKGDTVSEGQLLGDSNFTREGTLALGKNLRVAYVPYYGANSNDAIVISEGAAKKLTSERLYKLVVPRDNDLTFNKAKHHAHYGHEYTKDQYSKLDEEGVIEPGAKILPKDPIVLGLRKTALSSDDILLGRLHRSLAKPHRQFSELWEHDHPGEVIDVVKTPKRIAITIKTQEPTGVGDKLSNRFGGKGVVSQILPDDQMIQDASGTPIDVLLTSAGVVSRINPGQLIESSLGKIVEKTGKPYKLEAFGRENNVQFAKDELKKHGLKDKETIYDPTTGKKTPGVFVGRSYIFKLFKSTDTNYSAHNIESYDANQQPTKGGVMGAKALGKMEFDALVAHNARNVLRDAATIKSQKNDEFWRAVQLGYPIPTPKTTFSYDKFLNMLTGAGVKVNRDKHILSLAPLTDEDVMDISSGEIRDAKIVKSKDLIPETGGLFDPALTGGLTGNKWSHITLAEPIVSPIFRDPVRRLLGLTNTQLDTMIKTKGASYIRKQLAEIDLHKKEKELQKEMEGKSATQLDNYVKQLKYISALKTQKLSPDKAYIISKVPVVPPVVRPIIPTKGGQQILYGDANPLYQDLIYINNQFKSIKESGNVPGEEERLRPALHDAVGAVYGVNEPVTAKSKARKHKGFLTYIAGAGSPKYGYFQSRILKRTQDLVGRATVAPDASLGMDEVGVPEDMLWTMYEPFIVRRLVQNGHNALNAKKIVEERHPAAREQLLKEIKERPLILNRAPSLHRYNMLGAFPKPIPGKTIRVSSFMESPQNMDYDGDTMQIHVPITDLGVGDVKNMTLSKLLFGDRIKNELLTFPQHEAIMGVNYAASQDEKNKPVHYKTRAAAMADYHSGKITLGTRVDIDE